jgi:hypothetical protein
MYRYDCGVPTNPIILSDQITCAVLLCRLVGYRRTNCEQNSMRRNVLWNLRASRRLKDASGGDVVVGFFITEVYTNAALISLDCGFTRSN